LRHNGILVKGEDISWK